MKLILGRAGTGKSTYIMNEIKKNIEEGFSFPLILVVPEQFTLGAEKSLIDTLDAKGIINTEVLSFKRLAYNVFNVNRVKLSNIETSGKQILIYNIMQKYSKDLIFLGRSFK